MEFCCTCFEDQRSLRRGKMDDTSNRGHSWYVWLIYLNIVLYATCYQIQRPLEPFMVQNILKSGDEALEYAKLQSFFSLIQMFGSLIVGAMIDRIGVKGGFFITFLASALSYYLLSVSTTINILYLSKIPTIFQAGFLCAQVGLSQYTSNDKERTSYLGKLTMSYTVGSVIGPALGYAKNHYSIHIIPLISEYALKGDG